MPADRTRRTRRTRTAAPALLAVAALVTGVLVAPVLAPSGSSAVAAAPADAPVRYVHDALGRLVTVMDSTGKVARYGYDAAGNITSITRSSAAARSVVDLTPRTATPGARLSIIGRGFSTTATDNLVKLNGTTAPVLAASTTRLVVTVPAGATSGPVTVTTPGGTASGASLTVQASPLPTVTGVSPSAVGPGDTLTVTGTNFRTGGLETWVAVNNTRAVVTSVTATRITATVPTYVTSGRVTVGTPYGRVTSTQDVTVAPAPVTAGEISSRQRITIGATTTVSVATAEQVALLVFDGKAGQRVTVKTSASTFSYAYVSLLRPDGAPVLDRLGFAAGRFFDTLTLPDDGTYTLVVDPDATSTGSLSLRVGNVPPDVAGTIAVGGATTPVTFSTPGQNGALTFTAAAGQRVALTATATSMDDYLDHEIDAPDGTKVYGSYVGVGGRTWSDVVTLPVAGTYTLALDPEDEATGRATYRLAAVPDDTTATIAVGGAARTVTTAAPGQDARLTFNGTAGQRVALTGTSTTMNDFEDFEIRSPSGARVYGSYTSPGGSTWSDLLVLPATGRYTIVIDPEDEGVGKVDYRLAAVPADVTGTLTVDGPQQAVDIAAPGQNASLTFAGTSGQRVVLTARGTTITYYADYELLAPGGAELVDTYVAAGGTTTSPTLTLPATGTYTLAIDPEVQATGRVTFQVTTAPPVAAAAPTEPPARLAPTVAPARPEPAGNGADYAPDLAWFQPATHTRPAPFATDDDASAAHEPTPWEHVPSLTARPGVTALTGRVLHVDGLPLAGVTLTLGEITTTTDATGRFILKGVPAGKGELQVDGATASTAEETFGFYEVYVDAVAGRTSVLPWTTWMTPLDLSSAVTLPDGPTTEDLTVTTDAVPGLEFRLPRGARVEGRDGAPVTQVSMTAIPVDRPPFPLPQLGVQVPVYFTLQPGSAEVLPYGGQIVYPNYSHEPPGKRVEFWSYEPDEGWEVYGHGHVTADGTQVVPEPGTRLYEFTGAMFNAGNSPPPKGPKPKNPSAADPVDLETGLFVNHSLDLDLPAGVPLSVERTSLTGDTLSRTFGVGSTMTYDMFLWSAHQYTEVDLILPTGDRVHLVRTSPGTSYSDAIFDGGPRPDEWSDAHLAWDNDLFGWVLTRVDGLQYEFEAYTPLGTVRDPYGNEVRLHRGDYNLVDEATTSDGRWVRFAYDNQHRMTSARDDAGRAVAYTYDAGGRLKTVTDPEGAVTTYGYDAAGRTTTITDGRGLPVLANTYDSAGRVETQALTDGGTYHFAYSTGSGGQPVTDVTDPVGAVTRTRFDGAGHVAATTEGYGTGKARTTTTGYDARGLLKVHTDPVGRRTEYAYEAGTALPTAQTTLAGTARAATWSATYDDQQRLATTSDPLGDTTTYDYAANGQLSQVTDPLGEVTTFSSDARGRVLGVTPAGEGLTTYAWSLGDLVGSTDALGRATTYAVDAAGLDQGVTDPLGATTRVRRDAVGRPTVLTDALGGTVEIGYDEIGNPLQVTDERGGVTDFTWDAMSRRRLMTDPLGRVDDITYDAAGHPVQRVRRTGATSTYTYDVLGRRVTAKYPGQPVVTRTWDAVDRLTRLTGPGGTITRTYDPLDGVATETTAQGTVTSAYDDLGRRTSVQVTGQPATTYAHDDAGQLTSITRAAQVATLGHDAAGRRSTTTLPNGVVTTSTRDVAGQLTALTYAKGSTVLGDLTYTYDAAGRRTSVGGSLARVALPAAVSSATYDAANRPLTWNGTPLTYDRDGNLTSDGTRSYTYDKRDRLTAVSGAVPATYAYDDLGRRASRTVAGVTTTTLFDGLDAVQETAGATTVPLFTGESGETLGRLAPGGPQWLLADALGSTLAVTGSSGSVQGSYTYEPFGAVTSTGTVGTNTFTFTGRPSDATGLSMHGARYLDAVLGRWLTEDPIGFAGGGSNLAQYVLGDPVDWVDLDGLDPGPKPPGDCNRQCEELDKTKKKVLKDFAKKGPSLSPKDAWKPNPKDEYKDNVKRVERDAKENSNSFFNSLKNAWNSATGALGGD